MTPYYDRDGITVYCARWEDVVTAGLVPVRDVALVHAAAMTMGLRLIWCEAVEEICRIAVGKRCLAVSVHAAPVAEPPGPLFAPR